MAGVAFRDVRKEHGDVVALDGLDLEVPDGELLAVVGPSGSGKTTALRCMAGLEAVTAGSVWIGDRDVTRVAPPDRNVSMVFQGFALFPHLTVEENIGFGLAVRRVGRDERRRRVDEAADLVGCSDLLHRRPWELSGGERQRAALARALVREPEAFLLDEPLSSLDAQLRSEMRAELRRLHDRLGATMVHVTHDQVEALTLGDRVAVLHRGRLQQVAPPDEVYRRPRNRFVATFIGSPPANLVPASLEDRRTLMAGPFRLAAPEGAGGMGDRPLEVAIRPERLRLGSPEGEGAAATVASVEVAGDVVHVRVDLDGGLRMIVRETLARRPRPNDALTVTVDPTDLVVLDAATGEAVAFGAPSP